MLEEVVGAASAAEGAMNRVSVGLCWAGEVPGTRCLGGGAEMGFWSYTCPRGGTVEVVLVQGALRESEVSGVLSGVGSGGIAWKESPSRQIARC